MKFKYNHDAHEMNEAIGISLDDFNKVLKKAERLGNVVINGKHCRSNLILHVAKYLRSVGVSAEKADEAALLIDLMSAHVRPNPIFGM